MRLFNLSGSVSCTQCVLPGTAAASQYLSGGCRSHLTQGAKTNKNIENMLNRIKSAHSLPELRGIIKPALHDMVEYKRVSYSEY